MLGYHLTLDMYGCNKEKISNTDFIYNILDKLPELICMTKITKPSVTLYKGNPQTFDKGGISAFVIIAESHISIHTFIEQSFASIDIFSCKYFDLEKTEKYLSEKFDAKRVEKNVINRGQEFPKDIDSAKIIVEYQRSNINNEQGAGLC